MYILAQDQNGLVRSKHKDCVFVPPKSTIFPPLYGVRLVWPISLISFAVSTAGSWRRPGVDAEKHVVCVRRYLRLQVHEISFAAVAGLCRSIVCADCISFAYCHVCGGKSILRCLLPRLWRDKQPFLISRCVGRSLPVVVCAHTSFSASTHVCGMGSYNRQRSARIIVSNHVGGGGDYMLCSKQSSARSVYSFL